MIISDIRSYITYYKVSNNRYFNKLYIKIILLQIPLVHCLLIELSLRVFGNRNYFYNIINYISELLIILEIYKNIIKKTYI